MKRKTRKGYKNDWQKDPQKIRLANELKTAEGKALKMTVVRTVVVEGREPVGEA